MFGKLCHVENSYVKKKKKLTLVIVLFPGTDSLSEFFQAVPGEVKSSP